VNIRRGRRPKPLTSSKHRVTPLGAALRAWREYRGLSQTELAIQAGLGVAQDGRAHISSIELGKIQRPEDETLHKIAAVLGLKMADLRSGSLPPTGQAQVTLETVQTLSQQEASHPQGLTVGQEIGHQIDSVLTAMSEAERRSVEPLIREVLSGLLRGIECQASEQLSAGANTIHAGDELSRVAKLTIDDIHKFLHGLRPNPASTYENPNRPRRLSSET
jgi:transcriptional regulator with XRE-family HTH domain